jgi:hypothetical protein
MTALIIQGAADFDQAVLDALAALIGVFVQCFPG